MSEDFDRLKAQKDALLDKGTLVWTTTRPSKEGWYWYKYTAEERDVDAQGIMRVFEIESGATTELVAINDDYYESVNKMSGEWAGPIEPPKGE